MQLALTLGLVVTLIARFSELVFCMDLMFVIPLDQICHSCMHCQEKTSCIKKECIARVSGLKALFSLKICLLTPKAEQKEQQESSAAQLIQMLIRNEIYSVISIHCRNMR